MRRSRPVILAAATLFLLIPACSTPENLTAPTLTPQFGGVGFDGASSVAANAGHPYIFVAGSRFPATPDGRHHHLFPAPL